MFNIQMRQFEGDEPTNNIGDDFVVKCGLGKSSLTFNESYKTTSAGKKNQWNINTSKTFYLGSAKCLLAAFLRIFYAKTVAPQVVTVLEMSSVRTGFMDLVVDASELINRRSQNRVRYAVRNFQFRKLNETQIISTLKCCKG